MFHFTEDYQLSNKKVALSPLAAEHFAPLFREADNEQIWKYFLENGLGKENFKVYFDQAIDNRKKGKEYPLVIKDKTRNAIAGMTRIYEVNNRLKIVKIGHTWIGKRFQGTGLNKNGKYLLFEFLFEEMGMERIGFGASAENIVSINALKSVGCQKRRCSA